MCVGPAVACSESFSVVSYTIWSLSGEHMVMNYYRRVHLLNDCQDYWTTSCRSKVTVNQRLQPCLGLRCTRICEKYTCLIDNVSRRCVYVCVWGAVHTTPSVLICPFKQFMVFQVDGFKVHACWSFVIWVILLNLFHIELMEIILWALWSECCSFICSVINFEEILSCFAGMYACVLCAFSALRCQKITWK